MCICQCAGIQLRRRRRRRERRIDRAGREQKETQRTNHIVNFSSFPIPMCVCVCLFLSLSCFLLFRVIHHQKEKKRAEKKKEATAAAHSPTSLSATQAYLNTREALTILLRLLLLLFPLTLNKFSLVDYPNVDRFSSPQKRNENQRKFVV